MATETIDYTLSESVRVWVTAEDGRCQAAAPAIRFQHGDALSRLQFGAVLRVWPERIRQTLYGIGSSFTESSAFVLAHLDPEDRKDLMKQVYSEEGANFSLARTPIGSCDFSVEGRYCYAPADDPGLEDFSIAVDQDGFDSTRYPGIRDTGFDLLPMIQEALSIKSAQPDQTLNLVASAWTAPPWMKDIGDWFIPMNPQLAVSGIGGRLLPAHRATYAEYLCRYLQAYRDQGVPVWAITPVNEPFGNHGQWESMHFSAEEQRDFIRDHLVPTLRSRDLADVRLFTFDHNRDAMEAWADVVLADPDTGTLVDGMAIHWYESTFKVGEDALDRLHDRYPDHLILHTEGCIDDLGKPAPPGIGDPERFQESGWFGNDAFWWNDNATDWAYTAPWPGVIVEDHPIYTPVHRYARNIIESFNHWVNGWIDWNLVLDQRGGPNHVGNFCGAPIMIDTQTRTIHYTPVFHVLSQLSRSIRPGDQVVEVQLKSANCGNTSAAKSSSSTAGGSPQRDDKSVELHACASRSGDGQISVQILNTARAPRSLALQIGAQWGQIELPANSLSTVQVRIQREEQQ